MTNLFEALQTKDTTTYNGAVTHSTTQNSVLDLFFLGGACRNESVENIERILQKAWSEDPKSTLKTIFYLGDIREGQGERRFFRIALKWIEKNYNEVINKIVIMVPEYNRWDSLMHLKSKEVLSLIYDVLCGAVQCEDPSKPEIKIKNDYMEKHRNLLAKWMPRRYNKEFAEFRIAFQKEFNMNDAKYRKFITFFSKTIEQQMSKKEWDKINYEHVPSVASNKYRKAFYRNDEERYKLYIEAVTKGEKKINASAIFPHDIYRSIKRGDNEQSVVAQWNALPNYLKDTNEKILPVCDVSGSMSGLPMDISVSLGLYFSERNNSIFKDGFITFSDDPKLQILKGNLIERTRQLESSNWSMTTNFEKVFDVILTKAKEGNVSKEDMPTTVLVFSDMEFNEASNSSCTNFSMIKQKYLESGYEFPRLVFWNVNGRSGNCPINKNDKAVLVSGASPSIIKTVLSAKADPIEVMNATINVDRYKIFESII